MFPWPQIVVLMLVVYVLVHSFCEQIKDESVSSVHGTVRFFAAAIGVGFVAFALHCGGFW